MVQSYIVPTSVPDVRYLFSIYLFLTHFVVCAFCRVVVILLESLNQDIESASYDYNNTVVIIKRDLLREWQCRYQMIGDLVEGINSSFGFVLLVFMAFETTWFVISSFCTVINFTDSDLLVSNPMGACLTVAFGLAAFVAFFALAYQGTSIKDLVLFR